MASVPVRARSSRRTRLQPLVVDGHPPAVGSSTRFSGQSKWMLPHPPGAAPRGEGADPSRQRRPIRRRSHPRDCPRSGAPPGDARAAPGRCGRRAAPRRAPRARSRSRRSGVRTLLDAHRPTRARPATKPPIEAGARPDTAALLLEATRRSFPPAAGGSHRKVSDRRGRRPLMLRRRAKGPASPRGLRSRRSTCQPQKAIDDRLRRRGPSRSQPLAAASRAAIRRAAARPRRARRRRPGHRAARAPPAPAAAPPQRLARAAAPLIPEDGYESIGTSRQSLVRR